MEQKHDTYDVPGLVIMTAKDRKKVPEAVLKSIDYVVELEDYTTPDQLELIILQRLKYANIDYEDESVLQEIVKYGKNELEQSIRFMRCCIAVMQSQGNQILRKEDVIRAARLNRLPIIDGAVPY
jgi:DNA helicase TIP49 (TBP-interacting protein)